MPTGARKGPPKLAHNIEGCSMAYKPVQNESAHLTDKNNRSAFESKHKPKKKRATESPAMKKPTAYEKSKAGKTRS
jgi:hypothetical protein